MCRRHNSGRADSQYETAAAGRLVIYTRIPIEINFCNKILLLEQKVLLLLRKKRSRKGCHLSFYNFLSLVYWPASDYFVHNEMKLPTSSIEEITSNDYNADKSTYFGRTKSHCPTFTANASGQCQLITPNF